CCTPCSTRDQLHSNRSIRIATLASMPTSGVAHRYGPHTNGRSDDKATLWTPASEAEDKYILQARSGGPLRCARCRKPVFTDKLRQATHDKHRHQHSNSSKALDR